MTPTAVYSASVEGGAAAFLAPPLGSSPNDDGFLLLLLRKGDRAFTTDTSIAIRRVNMAMAQNKSKEQLRCHMLHMHCRCEQ